MRILLAYPRYPWPPRRGDQLRAAQLTELLGERHEVTLLVPEPPGAGGGAAPPEGRVRVIHYRRRAVERVAGLAAAALAGRPLQGGLYASRDLASRLAALAPEHDVAVLGLARLGGFLDALGETPAVVDLIDSLALSTRLRARYDRLWLRPALALEARRLALWERRLVERAAGALVVAPRDREAIAAGLRADAAERIEVVPVAIPETLSRPPRAASSALPAPASSPHAAAPPLVVLTGNLGYFPTRDGLTWFLDRVWPRLARDGRDGEVRLRVAGARPPRSLSRAVRRAGGELVADPPELAPLLAGAALAIAPLRAGAGQPLKVMEAWEAGVPVVATPWAAAGTCGVAGEDLLVAETAEEWVEAIRRLVREPGLAVRLAASARARLEAIYRPRAVGERLEEVLAAVRARD